MNKDERRVLNAVYKMLEEDDTLINIGIDREEGLVPCIRELSRNLKITEKDCEVYVSALMSQGFLKEPDDFLGPKTVLELTEEGKIHGKPINLEEAEKTHLWQQMGSYSDGAGQITKDKWFPMGSYCKKCGVMIKQFRANPYPCSKK